MSRKAAKYQSENYLRKSIQFNYKPYRRPKTLQKTIRFFNYSLFEEESEESDDVEEFEEDDFEEEFEEDDFEEECEEEFDKEQSEESEDVEESEQEFEENQSTEETGEDVGEESEEEQSTEEFKEKDNSDESEDNEVFEDFEDLEESEEVSAESDEGEESEDESEEREEYNESEDEKKFEEKEEFECESEENEESEDQDKFEEKEAFGEKASEKEEELKMALVNARSILKFINRGDATLAELIQKNDLDVLLITETWLPTENLTNNDLRRILPPDYYIVDEPRFYGRGGGVAIVHHKSLICKQVQFEFPSTFEFVATAVRRPGSKETVLILSVYRPPGGSVTELANDFLSELHLLLSDVYARYENVIIGGDFNIWFDCPEMTVTQEFEGFMRDNGLVQHVWRPTHEGGHILDLVLSRPNVRITNVTVRSNRFSDHSTVLFRARF